MIPRYSRKEMAAIWEPENYFRIQVDIEIYACEAQEGLGVIPAGVALAVREKGAFEVERIREIERETGGARVAIVALTANATVEDRRAALEAGVDEYLVKPFDPPKLAEAIERALGHAPEVEPTRLLS